MARLARLLSFLAALAALPAPAAAHGPVAGAAGTPTGLPVREQQTFGFPDSIQGVRIDDPANGSVIASAVVNVTVSGSVTLVAGRVLSDGASVVVRDGPGDGAFTLGTVRAPVQCVGNCAAATGARFYRLGPVSIPLRLLPTSGRRAVRHFVLRAVARDNPSRGRSTVHTAGATVSFEPPGSNRNLFAQALEVTQSVQNQAVTANDRRLASRSAVDYPGGMPLIAGKPTAVRLLANVESPGPVPVANVSGVLRGFRGGQELPGSPLLPIRTATVSAFTLPANDMPATLDLFDRPGTEIAWRMPDEWTSGRVTLRADVNGASLSAGRQVDECPGCQDAANQLATRVDFRTGIRRLRLDPFVVRYRPGDDEPFVTAPAALPAELENMRRLFPVRGDALDIGGAAGVIQTQNPECSDLLNALFFASLSTARSGLPIAVLPDHPDMCRVSNSPFTADDDLRANGMGGGAGAVWRTQANGGTTATHELGHVLGLPHASCDHDEDLDGAGGCDASFRPSHGALGGHGYAPVVMGLFPRAVGDEHAHDVMSYGPFRWISTTNYDRLVGILEDRQNDDGVVARTAGGDRDPWSREALRLALGRPAGAPRESLVVTASVTPDGRGTIGRAARIAVSPVARGRAGAFALRALDAAGGLVGEHRLDLDRDGVHGPPVTVTGATFPSPARIATLVLERDGQEIARRAASSAAPTVRWTDAHRPPRFPARGTRRVSWTSGDRDGDRLTYVVQFSADGGRTWRTLDPQVPGLTYDLDLRRLPGTDDGRFRVVATDGLRSTTDVSDQRVTIANHPPEVDIGAPVGGGAVTAGTVLPLAGSAVDAEERTLPASRLRWSSSRDGALGSGPSPLAWLSVGRHTLTLAAVDEEGARGTARVVVTVGAAAGDSAVPRLRSARRVGSRSVELVFSEEVVGFGTRSFALAGAGAPASVGYEPAARRVTLRFARAVRVGRLTVRSPLSDVAGNAIRTTTVALR